MTQNNSSDLSSVNISQLINLHKRSSMSLKKGPSKSEESLQEDGISSEINIEYLNEIKKFVNSYIRSTKNVQSIQIEYSQKKDPYVATIDSKKIIFFQGNSKKKFKKLFEYFFQRQLFKTPTGSEVSEKQQLYFFNKIVLMGNHIRSNKTNIFDI